MKAERFFFNSSNDNYCYHDNLKVKTSYPYLQALVFTASVLGATASDAVPSYEQVTKLEAIYTNHLNYYLQRRNAVTIQIRM